MIFYMFWFDFLIPGNNICICVHLYVTLYDHKIGIEIVSITAYKIFVNELIFVKPRMNYNS